jgi:hypothetical protein
MAATPTLVRAGIRETLELLVNDNFQLDFAVARLRY